MSSNLTEHIYNISKAQRNSKNKHNSFVIWLTGLSGSGKSTIANELEKALFQKGVHTSVLDGDNIRKGINSDLGFTDEARKENIRRVAEIAKLLMDAGVVVITAFISPFEEDRQNARKIIGEQNYFEIFIDCPIAVCEKRDVKGLYNKARQGEIANFTGINSNFETPMNCHLKIETDNLSVEQSVNKILSAIEHLLKPNEI